MASTTVRIIYDRDDIRRLIAADLERRGYKQAASQAENGLSMEHDNGAIILGHDYGDRDCIVRRIVIDEVQVRDWIETEEPKPVTKQVVLDGGKWYVTQDVAIGDALAERERVIGTATRSYPAGYCFGDAIESP